MNNSRLKTIVLVVIYALCAFAIGLYFISVGKNNTEIKKPAPTEVVVAPTELAAFSPTPSATSTPVPTETFEDGKNNNDISDTDAGDADASADANEGVTTGIAAETVLRKGKITYEQQLSNRDIVISKITNNEYDTFDNTKSGWWFVRKKNHERAGSGQTFDIETYDTFYIGLEETAEEKVVYLTFDCGYPSKNSAPMLDTLKAHNATATFFVTGMYLEYSDQYVKRMREEGHNIGNHTAEHLYLPELSEEEMVEQISYVTYKIYEITGTAIDPFFRNPGGYYSKRSQQIVSDLGYYSFMWSLAYGDYDKNNQPTVDYVVDHISTNVHNGAVILMHMDSDANCAALDSVLTMLENMGYRFGNLYDFIRE